MKERIAQFASKEIVVDDFYGIIWDRGRPTVEINPDQTEISNWVDIKMPLGAAEALHAIWSATP